MAYLDYPGLAYFKSLLDENYLRTNYEGDTVIDGNVTFTNPVDASVKNDWLGQQIDKTYLKDVVPDPEGSGALALILGDGTVSHLITDTTVTQVRSNANELYPILLCYDASAEEDQIAKKVWYGNGVRINPRYGYLYSQKMLTLHPTYNRAAAPTSRVEWTNDFRDSVLNPVGQIFEYIDPVSQGGEHRMELRLYGNPNVAGINTPNVNYETNTVSLGVSATTGDALTFFGYAPSTPIYLEDGTTMRKSLVRGDQYGKDIITRDWLNLNGSITGLVHTYMDETIDGYKTFLKTVTIDSGDDNNKAGLNVQGDVNIDSGDDANPSNLHVQGDGDIDGDLNVDGNSHIHGNEIVDGNETVHGDLTVDSGDPNDPSHIYVQGEIYHPGENGEDPVEYISYITNQQEFRTEIVEHLLPIGKGLAKDSDGKIYVDFSQIDEDTKAEILSGLDIQVPLAADKTLRVNNSTGSDEIPSTMRVSTRINTKFKTIQACVNWATRTFALNNHSITILIDAGTYDENVTLPEMNTTTGRCILRPSSGSNDVIIQKSVSSGGAGYIVYATGGIWQLDNLTISHKVGPNVEYGYTGSCLTSTNNAIVHVYGCSFTSSGSNNSTGTVRMICADSGGRIQIHPGYSGGTISVNTSHLGNANVLVAIRTGVISLWRSSASLSDRTYNCSGSCTCFTVCSNGGSINGFGIGDSLNFTGNITGKRYQIQTGSFCNTGSGDENFFPGGGADSEGTTQASTYSWYY